MNEFIFISSTLICLFSVILFYRFLGKMGLFVWVAIASILANIIVAKCITLFGLAASAGNILYASTFLATDILSENHSHKDARLCVIIGTISIIVYLAVSQITLLFAPNEFDFISPYMSEIFKLAPRITITSIVCYYISNTLDTYLYQWFSKKTVFLWLKNNGSTWTSQFIDSVLFSIIAFAGVMPIQGIVEFAITTYIIKIIVALLDTPFIYIAKKMHNKRKINTL